MCENTPISPLAYALLSCEAQCAHWQRVSEDTTKRSDELKTKVLNLQMELDTAKGRINSLTMENGRLSLALNHMVCWRFSVHSS